MDDKRFSVNDLPDTLKWKDVKEMLNSTPAPSQATSTSGETALTPEQLSGIVNPSDSSVSGGKLADMFGLPSGKDMASGGVTPVNPAYPFVNSPEDKLKYSQFLQDKASNKDDSNKFLADSLENSYLKQTPTMLAGVPYSESAPAQEDKTQESPAETGSPISKLNRAMASTPSRSLASSPSESKDVAPSDVLASSSVSPKNEDTEMKNALALAAQNRENVGWQTSLKDMMGGLASMGGLKVTPENKGLELMAANVDAPVAQIVTARDQLSKYLANQNAQAKADPNSDVSRAAQYVAMRGGMPAAMVKGKSANDLDDNMKNLASIKQHEESVQARKDIAQQHSDDLKLRYAELNQNRAIQASAKANEKQIAALGKTQQMMEQMRGNPAVQQAEKDIYAAAKVNSMVNLKGDPNKLDPQQVQLLASEVGKIATGGVPTAHELQGLNVSTIPSSLASVTQSFLNRPSAANKGEFVKSMQDYVNSLQKDAQKVITDRYGRVLEVSKGHLNPEDYQTLKTQYMGRFESPDVVAAISDDRVNKYVSDAANAGHTVTPDQVRLILSKKDSGK
jgi:hypothetical protein